MKSIKIIVCGFAITFLLITSKAKAQKKDELISEKQQLAIFNKSIQLLKENYVFPEKIAGIETEIKMQFANKQYAAFINVVTFTKKLTEDLELYGKDRHLGIFYSKERVSKIKSQNNLTEIPKSFLSKIKSEIMV